MWSKHTADLIGSVGLGDVNLNYATLQEIDAITSHVPVFFLRSVVNPFKFSLANFATKRTTASQIFPLFWKAVAICETQCAIKVVAATCDGASASKFFMNARWTNTWWWVKCRYRCCLQNIIFLVKISVISTSFLTHHIYLKLRLIVWIILGLERLLVLSGMVVSFQFGTI